MSCSFLICILSVCILTLSVFAHSGKTDSQGGHTDSSTGKYHFHHGYPAHDHEDLDGDGELDCPYSFDDQTDHSYHSSSKSTKTTERSYPEVTYTDKEDEPAGFRLYKPSPLVIILFAFAFLVRFIPILGETYPFGEYMWHGFLISLLTLILSTLVYPLVGHFIDLNVRSVIVTWIVVRTVLWFVVYLVFVKDDANDSADNWYYTSTAIAMLMFYVGVILYSFQK